MRPCHLFLLSAWLWALTWEWMECVWTLCIYFVPKIHKHKNPGRPIVSACSGPTELISSYLEIILASIVKTLLSYIKTSQHALENFRNFNFLGHRKELKVWHFERSWGRLEELWVVCGFIYIHTYMHTCIHAYMHTCIHAYIHTYIHAYIHTYIHAYMHTYIYTSFL